MRALFALRAKRGLSQAEVGDLLGVTASTISMWETGKSVPGPERVHALAVAFQVGVDFLLGGPDQENPPPADTAGKEESDIAGAASSVEVAAAPAAPAPAPVPEQPSISIQEACGRCARALMLARDSRAAEEAVLALQRRYEQATGAVLESDPGVGGNPALVADVICYLADTMAPTAPDELAWFPHSLRTLLALVYPSEHASAEGIDFLKHLRGSLDSFIATSLKHGEQVGAKQAAEALAEEERRREREAAQAATAASRPAPEDATQAAQHARLTRLWIPSDWPDAEPGEMIDPTIRRAREELPWFKPGYPRFLSHFDGHARTYVCKLSWGVNDSAVVLRSAAHPTPAAAFEEVLATAIGLDPTCCDAGDWMELAAAQLHATQRPSRVLVRNVVAEGSPRFQAEGTWQTRDGPVSRLSPHEPTMLAAFGALMARVKEHPVPRVLTSSRGPQTWQQRMAAAGLHPPHKVDFDQFGDDRICRLAWTRRDGKALKCASSQERGEEAAFSNALITAAALNADDADLDWRLLAAKTMIAFDPRDLAVNFRTEPATGQHVAVISWIKYQDQVFQRASVPSDTQIAAFDDALAQAETAAERGRELWALMSGSMKLHSREQTKRVMELLAAAVPRWQQEREHLAQQPKDKDREARLHSLGQFLVVADPLRREEMRRGEVEAAAQAALADLANFNAHGAIVPGG